MYPFVYGRAASTQEAVHAAHAALSPTGPARASRPPPPPPTAAPAQFIAGGTQMVDLMKLGVMAPDQLVDIADLKLAGIEIRPDGVLLGATTRMSELERHPEIRRLYPVLAQTMALAASQQIRNMATLAGNVLQRTRCSYFRDAGETQCNKRAPGSGCAALDGVNRKHAILGVSDRCIASYPGDFAQALVALGAETLVTTQNGARRFAFEQLHRDPDDPARETALEPGEIITAFFVPAGKWTRRSTYVKVRDRESYAYGLATAAVALDLDGDVVREARIGLGGVAYRPWRAHEAEQMLRGKRLDEPAAEHAARAAFAAARPRGQNAFKVDLGQRTLVRALLQAKAIEI